LRCFAAAFCCDNNEEFPNPLSERKVGWVGDFSRKRRSRFRHYKWVLYLCLHWMMVLRIMC